MSEEINDMPLPDLFEGTVDDQAEAWLVYLYSGAASEAGVARFRLWLEESARHRTAYAQTEQLWRDLTYTDGAEPEPAPFGVPAARVDWSRRRRPAVRPDLAVKRLGDRAGIVRRAASIAAGIAVFGVFVVFAMDRVETRGQYMTAPGEVRTVTLGDGSEVTMGGDTQLKTAFSRLSRKVEFVQGGAYFKVSKNPQRPFSVFVGKVAVTVKGTAFDVRANPDDVRVSVTEGRVRVAMKPGLFGESGPVTYLGAGQQVVATRAGVAGVPTAFDRDRVLAWSEGTLIYDGEKLSTVIAEVNRYRTDKIRLTDPTMGDKTITLILPTGHTDSLLSALRASENVTITRSSSEVVISPKN